MAGIKTPSGVIKFVAPMMVKSNQPVFVADSINLKRYAASMEGVQRWEIETNVMPSNSSAEYLIHSVINGYSTVFDVEMPQVYRGSTEVVTGSTTATGSSGSFSISVQSSSNLKRGDFVSFGNHSKVYLITAVSSGSITIFPRLRTAVSNTALYYGNNVIMKAYYDTDVMTGISYIDGIISDPGIVKLVEAV